MSLFSYISDFFSNSKHKVLCFFLNSSLRPYIKTPIASNIFQSGDVHLENIDLDETVVSTKIPASLPILVTAGRFDSLSISVPWSRLATDGIRVKFRGLRLSLALKTDFSKTAPPTKVASSTESLSQQLMTEASAASSTKEWGDLDENEEQSSATTTLSTLEELFQHLLETLDVEAEDTELSIASDVHSSQLVLRLESIHFWNHAPSPIGVKSAKQSRKVEVGLISLLLREANGKTIELLRIDKPSKPASSFEGILLEYSAETLSAFASFRSRVMVAALPFEQSCSPIGVLLRLASNLSLAFAAQEAARDGEMPLSASLASLSDQVTTQHKNLLSGNRIKQQPSDTKYDDISGSILFSLSPLSNRSILLAQTVQSATSPLEPVAPAAISFGLDLGQIQLSFGTVSDQMTIVLERFRFSFAPDRSELKIQSISGLVDHEQDSTSFLTFVPGPGDTTALALNASFSKTSPTSKISTTNVQLNLVPFVVSVSPPVLRVLLAVLAECKQKTPPIPVVEAPAKSIEPKGSRLILQIPSLNCAIRLPQPLQGAPPKIAKISEYFAKEGGIVLEVVASAVQVESTSFVGPSGPSSVMNVQFPHFVVFVQRGPTNRRRLVEISGGKLKTSGEGFPCKITFTLSPKRSGQTTEVPSSTGPTTQKSTSGWRVRESCETGGFLRSRSRDEFEAAFQCPLEDYTSASRIDPQRRGLNSSADLKTIFSDPFVFYSVGSVPSPDHIDLEAETDKAVSKLVVDLPYVVGDVHPMEWALITEVGLLFSGESPDMMSILANIYSLQVKLHDGSASAQDTVTNISKSCTLKSRNFSAYYAMNFAEVLNANVAFVAADQLGITESNHVYQSSYTQILRKVTDVSMPPSAFPHLAFMTSRLRLWMGLQLTLGSCIITPLIPAFSSLAAFFSPTELEGIASPQLPSPAPVVPSIHASMKRACVLVQSPVEGQVLLCCDGLELHGKRSAEGILIEGPLLSRICGFVSCQSQHINPTSLLSERLRELEAGRGWACFALTDETRQQQVFHIKVSIPSDKQQFPRVHAAISMDQELVLRSTEDVFGMITTVLGESLEDVTRLCIGYKPKPTTLSASAEVREIKKKAESLVTLHVQNLDKCIAFHDYAQDPTATPVVQAPQLVIIDREITGDSGSIIAAAEASKPLSPDLVQHITDILANQPQASSFVSKEETVEEDDEDDEQFFDASSSLILPSVGPKQSPESSCSVDPAVSNLQKLVGTSQHTLLMDNTETPLGTLLQFSGLKVRVELHEGFFWKKFEERDGGTSSSAGKDRVTLFLELGPLRLEIRDSGMRVILSVEKLTVDDEGTEWKSVLAIDEFSKHYVKGSPLGAFAIETRATSFGTQALRILGRLSPQRVYLTHKTLCFLLNFLNFRARPEEESQDASLPSDLVPSQELPKNDPFIDELDLGPVHLTFNFKQSLTSRILKFNTATSVWVLKLLPNVTGAHIDLRRVVFRDEPLSVALDHVKEVWFPTGTQVFKLAGSLGPIHILWQLASGPIDLVKVPLKQYKEDGDILRGVRKGVSTMIVDFLKVPSQASVGVLRLLRNTDSALSSGQNTSVNVLADTPTGLLDGGWRAVGSLTGGIKGAFEAFWEPVTGYKESGTLGLVAGVAKVPLLMVIRPVKGATGALTDVILGVRNSLDPTAREKDKAKYSSSSAAAGHITTSAIRDDFLESYNFFKPTASTTASAPSPPSLGSGSKSSTSPQQPKQSQSNPTIQKPHISEPLVNSNQQLMLRHPYVQSSSPTKQKRTERPQQLYSKPANGY